MTLADIIRELNLTLLTDPQPFEEKTPSAGYTSDLLSCVMANAPHQCVWVTLQAHINIVAVSALLDICAVIITEGALPDPATIESKRRGHRVIIYQRTLFSCHWQTVGNGFTGTVIKFARDLVESLPR